MAQGLINNGVSVTKNFTPNELELLVDYEVTGSAVTQVDFTSLNIQEDEEVKLSMMLYNAGGSYDYSLLVNGNTTNSNYYKQELNASNTTIQANRTNFATFDYVVSSYVHELSIYIKLTNNGYYTVSTNCTRKIGTSSIELNEEVITSTFTITSITSLKVQANSTANIGIGSRFQLYKVKGQVQQTWATT